MNPTKAPATKSLPFSIVMKFGSSCLYSTEGLQKIHTIIKDHRDQRPVIVLSAFSSVTDRLIEAGKESTRGSVCIKKITRLHFELLEKLALQKNIISNLLSELHSLLIGISLTKEFTPKLRDIVLSFGERLIIRIFSAYLNKLGTPSLFMDGWDAGIMTDSSFSEASVMAESYSRIQSRFTTIRSGIPIVGGFMGKDREGSITTLGRGGSDLTASIIGAAIRVKEIQFWKDVAGILTADPTVVKDAKHVTTLSYKEASELAYFGSKVLHPSSILPAIEANIPVKIKNHLKPGSIGTTVMRHNPVTDRFVGIAHKDKQVLVHICSTRMLGQSGFLMKVFDIFDRLSLSVDVVVTSEVSLSITLPEARCLSLLKKNLENLATVTLSKEMTTISLIGGNPGFFLQEAVHTLRKNGIEIKMISYGASKINTSVVVNGKDAHQAVQILHRTFCLHEDKK